MKNKKIKDYRDYAITGIGFVGAAIGAALVVAEIPALVVGGAGVVLAGSALKRLSDREEACCEHDDCACND